MSAQELKFKVIFVGDANVGKSSFLLRATGYPFSEDLIPTIGSDYTTKAISRPDLKVNVKLNLWDTQGQERFRTTSSSYHRGTHAVVVMYDIDNRESFQNATMWYEDTIVHCKPEETLYFFIGHKSDLEKSRKVTYAEGKDLAESLRHPFFEASSKANDNIDHIMSELCDVLLTKHMRLPSQSSKPSKDVKMKESKKFSLGNLFKRSKSSPKLVNNK